MSRRRKSREVEIFNFSFLDILACTIGLLIFIMVMVFVLQSNSPVADTHAVADHQSQEATRDQQSAARDDQIAATLESQLSHMVLPVQETDLARRRDDAKAERDHAADIRNANEKELALAQATLDQAQADHEKASAAYSAQALDELTKAQRHRDDSAAQLAKAKFAADHASVTLAPLKRPGQADDPSFEILHVDCRSGSVVMMKMDSRGKIKKIGETPAGKMSDIDSDFQRFVSANNLLDHPLVLFWIRPGAGPTFDSARHEMPASTTYGYEPADAEWIFGNSSR